MTRWQSTIRQIKIFINYIINILKLKKVLNLIQKNFQINILK